MKRRILALGLILAMTVSLSTGCMKIIKVGEEGKYTGVTEFNAGDDVKSVWDSNIMTEMDEKAVELSDFLTEAGGDLNSLAEKYGKYSMGSSGELSYVVKGTGTVEEVNQESRAGYMTVTLDGYDGPEVIQIQIGSVYKGSSIRDSLDFIDFNDYTNQQEWAAISQSINSIVDEEVVQAADPAGLSGKTVTFEGAFTVSGNESILITPVRLETN